MQFQNKTGNPTKSPTWAGFIMLFLSRWKKLSLPSLVIVEIETTGFRVSCPTVFYFRNIYYAEIGEVMRPQMNGFHHVVHIYVPDCSWKRTEETHVGSLSPASGQICCCHA